MPLLNVQLTDEQLKVVLEAVTLWETQPISEEMTKSIIRTVVSRDETPEQATKRTEIEIAKAKSIVQTRRFASISIQMRVMTVLANPKEHEVSS